MGVRRNLVAVCVRDSGVVVSEKGENERRGARGEVVYATEGERAEDEG